MRDTNANRHLARIEDSVRFLRSLPMLLNILGQILKAASQTLSSSQAIEVKMTDSIAIFTRIRDYLEDCPKGTMTDPVKVFSEDPI